MLAGLGGGGHHQLLVLTSAASSANSGECFSTSRMLYDLALKDAAGVSSAVAPASSRRLIFSCACLEAFLMW